MKKAERKVAMKKRRGKKWTQSKWLRIIAVLVAVLMVLSVAIPALADELPAVFPM